MTLLARIEAATGRAIVRRICVDCRVHEAIVDGSRCHDCLNAYMRETRPAPVSPWVARARAHELPAKAMLG